VDMTPNVRAPLAFSTNESDPQPEEESEAVPALELEAVPPPALERPPLIVRLRRSYGGNAVVSQRVPCTDGVVFFLPQELLALYFRTRGASRVMREARPSRGDRCSDRGGDDPDERNCNT